MRPQWDTQIGQLDEAINQIRSVFATLPQTFATAQGITATTEGLVLTLEELKAAMQQVNNSAEIDPILLGIHQNGVLSQIPNILAYAGQLLSNPSATVLDQIAQQTWSIRASATRWTPNSSLRLLTGCAKNK